MEGHSLFSVHMGGTNHLRKVDDDGLTRLALDEDVEFVKVTVNKSGVRKAYDEVHEIRIESTWRGDIGNLSSARCLS